MLSHVKLSLLRGEHLQQPAALTAVSHFAPGGRWCKSSCAWPFFLWPSWLLKKKNVSLARLWHMLAKEHVWCCSESHNREVSCLGNMSTIIACEKGALAFFTPWRKMLLCLCYIVQAWKPDFNKRFLNLSLSFMNALWVGFFPAASSHSLTWVGFPATSARNSCCLCFSRSASTYMYCSS